MFPTIFTLIKPAPPSVKVKSRDACIYLYRAMTMIGLLPTKRYRFLYYFWTFTTFSFILFYVPMGFLASYIFDFSQFKTATSFLTSLQIAINCAGIPIKAIIIYFQIWRLFQANEIMDEIDNRWHTESVLEKRRKMVADVNFIIIVFTLTYESYVSVTFFTGFAKGHPAWQMYNPVVDWHKTTLNLLAVSFFEYILMSGIIWIEMIVDSYAVVFTMVLRSQLDVLKDNIRNLHTDKNLSADEHHEQLIQCITDHKLIIKYCNCIRPLISLTIFVQFLIVGSTLGLTLINMFFFADFWSILACCNCIMGILLQTFPLCYICNLLLTDSETLSDTLFQSNWIDAEPRYKKTTLHFLTHLHQPIVFSALGVFDVCMATNLSFAKFAFSVITIAKQINFGESFK